jgi:hypothetical protein
MNELFSQRVAELDTLVERCKLVEPFASARVSDASNRSSRDWPWWSVQLECTEVDGPIHRRATATITLISTQDGDPAEFKGEWRAQVWSGVGTNSFDQSGVRELAWDFPSERLLIDTVLDLLAEGRDAIDRAERRTASNNP